MSLIDQIVALAALPADKLPEKASVLAHFSLLDWMACGIAGINEPVAQKLRQLAEDEGGSATSTVIGAVSRPSRMAALVNGATSHALDYDDTHFAHVGHLSVGIYPAALAAAEEVDATAGELIAAFLTGAEAAIRIGIVLGKDHYNHGFHQTATAGAFGATIAAGRLYGLNAEQMRNALGLCATRASGLKSQFGTMGKPYNAGIAASNGIECAKLARLGMTSADDGLEGSQGFIPTHHASLARNGEETGFDHFLFEDNKYKLHACCHGLHAMIEALKESGELRNIDLAAIAAIELRTNPRWLKVCDIKAPRTGLEVKFSYNWLAGMTLRGDQTGDDRIYTDELTQDAELVGLAGKITVSGDESLSDMESGGFVTLLNNSQVDFHHDLAAPLDRDVLATKLRNKAVAIIGERGAQLWEQFADIKGISAREIGRTLSAG